MPSSDLHEKHYFIINYTNNNSYFNGKPTRFVPFEVLNPGYKKDYSNFLT